MSLYPITTTLNAIRACNPCEEGWKTLLKGLGKPGADSDPLLLTEVLRINGFNDALWCLRALPRQYLRDMRLFAVACTRQVQHLMRDPKSVEALDVAERFANGQAREATLQKARAAARAAAHDTRAAAHDTRAAADAAHAVTYAYAVRAAADAAAAAAAAPSAGGYGDTRKWQEELFIAMCQGTAPWQQPTQGDQS